MIIKGLTTDASMIKKIFDGYRFKEVDSHKSSKAFANNSLILIAI